jgi:hypothetical protein
MGKPCARVLVERAKKKSEKVAQLKVFWNSCNANKANEP